MNLQDLGMRIEFDYTKTCWPSVEAKLGRKLLPVENQGLTYTSGMFKEWFFGNLNSFPNEEVERIIDLKADYVYGWANRPDKPERKNQTPPWEIKKPEPIKKSFWQRLIDKIMA